MFLNPVHCIATESIGRLGADHLSFDGGRGGEDFAQEIPAGLCIKHRFSTGRNICLVYQWGQNSCADQLFQPLKSQTVRPLAVILSLTTPTLASFFIVHTTARKTEQKHIPLLYVSLFTALGKRRDPKQVASHRVQAVR